ncbi:M23 family metallopeptidase [soil metagenome]
MRTYCLFFCWFCLVQLVLLGTSASAQVRDTLNFGSPLAIPIYLSGTFGEPRGNHFHSGMDIRTNSQEGLPVFSVQDGFVSRIKISGGGYGKSIYIQHPNGYTSVYAHLSAFPPALDKVIKELHYKRENFEIDEFLGPNTYPVKKGEIVAYSGNTGGSAGPHLHFEIRNTQTQYAYNPQLYGFTVADNVPPIIHNLFVYAKDLNLVSPQTYAARKVGSSYRLAKDTLYFNTDTIGFGLHTTDKMQNSNNTNGIYSLEICLNDSICYRFKMDSIDFAETRYVQCLVDHCEKVESGNSVYRTHRLPGNDFALVYDIQQNDGYIVLKDSVFQKIELSSRDYQGNASTLVFYVSRNVHKPTFKMQPMDFDTVFYHDRANTFHGTGLKAYFPAQTFYNKVFFYYKADSIQLSSYKAFGPLHRLHKDVEPVHKSFGLSLFVNELPLHLQDKGVVVRIDRKGRIKAYTTKHEGAWFSANPKEFGNFTLLIDTVPPSIRPQNFTNGSSMVGKKELRLLATDNLSGIVSYRATIDGKWILLDCDTKNSSYVYTFDNHCPPGEHIFEMIVTDDVGNVATYRCTFKN